MSSADAPLTLSDDTEHGRIAVMAEDAMAELVYDLDRNRLLLLHTEVPDAFSGQGIGDCPVSAAIGRLGGHSTWSRS